MMSLPVTIKTRGCLYVINGTTCEPTLFSARLDYHGLLHALTLLQTDSTWKQKLSELRIFDKVSNYYHPEAIRLSDFLTKVSIPLDIPFYLLWVWMCSDFFIPVGVDPFTAAENYLKKMLSPGEYLQVTNNKHPVNLRKGLRLQRNALHLSLAQMADKIGVNRDKIAVLERRTNQTSMPRCDSLNAVLPFYELHPVELYVLALKDEDPYVNSS